MSWWYGLKKFGRRIARQKFDDVRCRHCMLRTNRRGCKCDWREEEKKWGTIGLYHRASRVWRDNTMIVPEGVMFIWDERRLAIHLPVFDVRVQE
jgi:hypothetical protein